MFPIAMGFECTDGAMSPFEKQDRPVFCFADYPIKFPNSFLKNVRRLCGLKQAPHLHEIFDIEYQMFLHRNIVQLEGLHAI